MSEQEAIKHLKLITENEAYSDYFQDVCKLAIQAIERQIPKKAILKSGESVMHINKGNLPHEWRVNKWEDWVCPCCGWFVGQRYNAVRSGGKPHPHDQRKSNYCNECGQRIDWSEEE